MFSKRVLRELMKGLCLGVSIQLVTRESKPLRNMKTHFLKRNSGSNKINSKTTKIITEEEVHRNTKIQLVRYFPRALHSSEEMSQILSIAITGNSIRKRLISSIWNKSINFLLALETYLLIRWKKINNNKHQSKNIYEIYLNLEGRIMR